MNWVNNPYPVSHNIFLLKRIKIIQNFLTWICSACKTKCFWSPLSKSFLTLFWSTMRWSEKPWINIFLVWVLWYEIMKSIANRDYPFSAYAKYSEKVTFLTSWHTHVRVRNGIRNNIVWEILHTFKMDDLIRKNSLKFCFCKIVRGEKI